MATYRPYFSPSCHSVGYNTASVSFRWHPGFALSQQQKNIKALHEAIQQNTEHDARILDVSTKSTSSLGARLSALNLTIPVKHLNQEVSVENIFQCAKIYDISPHEPHTIGPFPELLLSSAKKIKSTIREQLSQYGNKVFPIIAFQHAGKNFPLHPTEGFYFFLYCHAVHRLFRQHPEFLQTCSQFQFFTDISFNPQKSQNCQAAALSFYLSVRKTAKEKLVPILSDYTLFFSTLSDCIRAHRNKTEQTLPLQMEF